MNYNSTQAAGFELMTLQAYELGETLSAQKSGVG